MKTQCYWQEKMTFKSISDGHEVLMDTRSPIGSDSAASPKQLVLMAICGCSAMDVVMLLKKFRQDLKSFDILAEADLTKGQPSVFKEVNLTFNITGNVEPTKAQEAVMLSQTKYCGVSAMIAKCSPIKYKVLVNGTLVAEGAADFQY